MLCIGCKTEVKAMLVNLELAHTSRESQVAALPLSISSGQTVTRLQLAGLQLVNDKKNLLIEKIKDVITHFVQYGAEPLTKNFSDYLSEKLGYNYTYLANFFSERLDISIEKYVIAKKIERVKELLLNNELRLTEISLLLHYSSVAHLSMQFKKVTGVTPSHFKALKKAFPSSTIKHLSN